MSTPDRRARDKDRDAAIEVVEAAWADGQIVEADRDKRVEELLRAQTLAEIDLLTRDLQGSAPPQPYPEHQPQPRSHPVPTRPPKALFVVPFVVVVVIVIAVIGAVASISGGIDEAIDEAIDARPGSSEPADVLTVEGYADLVAAVEAETGGSQVFDAVLYPAYAVVSLPVDASGKREESWYWDGSTLDANDIKSTSTYPRFDLATVDAQVLLDLVDRVKPLVEDAETWYAIVRAPDADGAVMWAYATNEYGESAYLAAKPDGTVTYDSTEHS